MIVRYGGGGGGVYDVQPFIFCLLNNQFFVQATGHEATDEHDKIADCPTNLTKGSEM